MSEYSEKCPSQFPGVEANVLKCLVLSDQQHKTQKYCVYNLRRQSANSTHWRSWNQRIMAFIYLFLIIFLPID